MLPCQLVPSSHYLLERWVIPPRHVKSIPMYMPRIASSNHTGITNQESTTIIPKNTPTPQKMNIAFIGAITIELDPALQRPLPTNENSIFLIWITSHMSLLTTINLFCHLESHLSWIGGAMESRFKYTFIYACPKVPISYLENVLPLILVSSSHLIIQVPKDLVPFQNASFNLILSAIGCKCRTLGISFINRNELDFIYNRL